MVEIEDNIRRSDAVHEMMARTPPWIARTGSILLFVWFCILMTLSFIIKYPEILDGPINITTKTPPAELVAKANGRINLLVANNDKVSKDQIIAYIKNPASFEEVVVLNRLMPFFENLVNNPTKIRSKMDTIPNLTNLGQVQNAYNAFVTKLFAYDLTYTLEKNKKLVASNLEQVGTLERKAILLDEKDKVLQQELQLAEDNFKKDQSLYERGHISKLDYDASKTNFLQTRKNIQANRQALIENRQNLQHLTYNNNELTLNDKEQKESLNVGIKASYNILVSELKAFKEEFFMTSPIYGNVTFFDVWNNNQFVNKGDQVAFIVTDSKDILGKLQVKGNKFGKVKLGQKVRVKLNSYPMSEYGLLFGKVSNISKVNKNNVYVIDVDLPDTLITTYKKYIPYKHEMKGLGEIITENMSIIERIFYQMRSLGRKEYIGEEELQKKP